MEVKTIASLAAVAVIAGTSGYLTGSAIDPALTYPGKKIGVEGSAYNADVVIRYGANGKFAEKTFKLTGPCNNATFGDPLYGTLKTCYLANGTSAPMPVPTPTPAPPSVVNWIKVGTYSVALNVTKPTILAGQIQTAKFSVKSTSAINNVTVGVKFLGVNNTYLIEKHFVNITLPANTQKDFSVDFALKGDAPTGIYGMALGVWSADWSVTHLYEHTMATYNVTAITQPVVSSLPLPPNTLSMITAPDAFVYAGPYFVQNNMWGSYGLPVGYSSKAGIGPVTASKSISARWTWNYPENSSTQEVKGYPAIGFGQKPGINVTPGSNLPMLVNNVKSAISSWDVQSIYTGKGQLAYDLWLTKDATKYASFPATPITHEIMLTVDSFGTYGEMRNPSWYVGSTIIDGNTYRVWKADNFGGAMNWRFIVLQLVSPVKMLKGSVDFKNVFTYLKSAGLITGEEYFSSIEFGNEMEFGTGDVYMKDFKSEVL